MANQINKPGIDTCSKPRQKYDESVTRIHDVYMDRATFITESVATIMVKIGGLLAGESLNLTRSVKFLMTDDERDSIVNILVQFGRFTKMHNLYMDNDDGHLWVTKEHSRYSEAYENEIREYLKYRRADGYYSGL